MNRSYPIRRPTVVDFFCGAGGLSLGFEQAGFDIQLGVDVDGHHIATHERNFPYGHSHCGSIVEMTGEKIKGLAGVDEIDVVIGGPPCQGFSHMGLRDLKDPRNSLVAHYMRLILEIRPKAFLMENVPGLISGATREILDEVISLAEAGGYVITKPVRVLDASEFGVPQKRRRLFLLGARADLNTQIEYPTGPCEGQPLRPTVLEAIDDLPRIENNERLFAEGFTRYTRAPKSLYAKVARGLIDDPSDLSRPRVWNNSICTGCARIAHSSKSVDLYKSTPPGQTVPGHKLPRLDPNGISPTLRAGSDSTHGSYTAPRPIHPLYPRCITAREAARLHGFPDWFTFYPLKWHAYRQIGNAVCPPIARALGSEILRALGGKTTKRCPTAVGLDDTFVLPEDRPRTLKRIPIMREFPPVIEYLLDKALDKSRKRLKKPTFSFSDVQEAIHETKATLHWVREDTFLAEVARSRAVLRILSKVHAAGYSIKQLTGEGAIGQFVPLGTPGTIEDKETIPIRIDEIHNAVSLNLPPMHLNGDPKAIELVIAEPEVRQRVWGRKDGRFIIAPLDDGLAMTGATSNLYSIDFSHGRTSRQHRSALLTSRNSAPITKSRITRVASDSDCDEVILMISATSKHFIAIRYNKCKTVPREASRTAFVLANPS